MKEIKRFLKDYKLPIQVCQEPYFSYYLNLIDPYFNSIEKYNLFKETYKNFKNEEDFISFGTKLVNKIVDYVKEKSEFQKFNTDDAFIKNLKFAQFQGKNLYIHPNENKRFFSIDLKKANYQSLNYYNKNILDNTSSYEEFISNFVDKKYFIESKQIRQAIFGNLNPKRQQTIQKHIISSFVPLIEKMISKENLRSLSSDEIIIKVSGESLSDLDLIFQENLESLGLQKDSVRLEEFTLRKFPSHDFYWKEFPSGKIEFRQVPGNNIYEVIKKYENKELHPYDLIFVQDNRLVSFLEPLFKKNKNMPK